ncbi:hypothetical protein BA190_01320 [Labrys sp. WJW]|nr:hypothetical protein BA190_01320 [Labrys sp. WJW]
MNPGSHGRDGAPGIIVSSLAQAAARVVFSDTIHVLPVLADRRSSPLSRRHLSSKISRTK